MRKVNVFVISCQAGVEKLSNLRVLYLSNNKITSYNEMDRLSGLDKLEDLLLNGNPLYSDAFNNNTLSEYRIEVRKAFRIGG